MDEILQTRFIKEKSMDKLSYSLNETLKSIPSKQISSIQIIPPYLEHGPCYDSGKFEFFIAVIVYRQ